VLWVSPSHSQTPRIVDPTRNMAFGSTLRCSKMTTDHASTKLLLTKRCVRLQQLFQIGHSPTVYAVKLLEGHLVLFCGIAFRVVAEHHADLLGA
jgi:hypothetical protein